MPSFYIPKGALHTTSPDRKLPAVQTTGNKNRGAGTVSNLSTQQNNNFLPRKKVQFKPAPVDEILKKNVIECDYCSEKIFEYVQANPHVQKNLQQYKSSIVRSLTLKKQDLQDLLQQEYQKLNRETQQIVAIKNNFNNASGTYRFANYQLTAQISKDIVHRNKQYKKLKEELNRILTTMTNNENVYVIEARNRMFLWRNKQKYRSISGSYLNDLIFVSIFNQKFEHLLTYNRMDIDVLKHSKINAATQHTQNLAAANLYQRIFDDYITDLSRIGKGLDVTNPDLLIKLGEMQDQTLSIKLK